MITNELLIKDTVKARLHWRFFSTILAANFTAISSAISRRYKLLTIQIAAESPVVYTGDLKSPQNRIAADEIAAQIAAKFASVNGPYGRCYCCWVVARFWLFSGGGNNGGGGGVAMIVVVAVVVLLFVSNTLLN